MRLFCLRATAATRAHNWADAKKDIETIRKAKGWEQVVPQLEIDWYASQNDFGRAEALLEKMRNKSPEDYRLEARVLELKADWAKTPFSERQALKDRALALKQKYGFALDYSAGD